VLAFCASNVEYAAPSRIRVSRWVSSCLVMCLDHEYLLSRTEFVLCMSLSGVYFLQRIEYRVVFFTKYN
jgi:hypothetical protein